MRNVITVLIILGAIWWAVENPNTATKVVDATKAAAVKVVEYFSD
jgi:hypothetical protein|tara:strand:- start:261 stop:395 length:135 start_codon:yes stop_codon:yes gene_type:complete